MRGHGTFVTGLITMALVGCLAVAAEAAPPTGTRTTAAWSSGLGDRSAGVPSSSVAVSSSKLLLVPPATTPPVDVPFGIGKTLYLNGRGYDQTARWSQLTPGQPSNRYTSEFWQVRKAWDTVMWLIPGYGCADPCNPLGRFRPGEPAAVFVRNGADLTTTSGGVVATQNCADVLPCTLEPMTPRGRLIRPFHASVSVQAAGGTFIVQTQGPGTQPSFALYPGYPAAQLPYDNTYGAGQGPGWLATRENGSYVCYRTAALASANALRARICSQTLPLISNDGTKAVVVQADHVRLYDTRTGLQINASASPTIAGAYEPLAWEAPNRYLVYAHDGTALVIMRCFVNRLCRRAVTAHTATGVTRIAH